MKKRLITGAVAILAWAGLMTGSAMALMIDYGTKIELVDWINLGGDTVRLYSENNISTGYDLQYSLNGGGWTNVSDSWSKFSGGDVLDFQLIGENNISYVLSQDAGDDRFSIFMRFDPIFLSSSIYRNVSIDWTIDGTRVGSNSARTSLWSDDTLSPVSTPVPEPGTMIILGTCLLCLGGAASRKKKKK